MDQYGGSGGSTAEVAGRMAGLESFSFASRSQARVVARERVEQVSLFPGGCAGQRGVPLGEDGVQVELQQLEVSQLLVQIGEAALNDASHLLTRRASRRAFSEDPRQLVQRKADDQRPLNQTHAGDRVVRIAAIAAGSARRQWQQSLALVVA